MEKQMKNLSHFQASCKNRTNIDDQRAKKISKYNSYAIPSGKLHLLGKSMQSLA